MNSNDEILLSTLNELSEAIVIYDENDDFVLCNEANKKLYPHMAHLYRRGVNLREILTHAIESGQFKLEPGQEKTFLEERIRQHWLPLHEVEQHLDGDRWLLVRNRRLENGLFIGFRTDITDIKKREMQLAEAKEEAERAKEAALAAELAKSEFLANMSHEIRTPMNGVLGMAELLRESELNSKQRMFTDVIVKSANALLTIINDILDFSKIAAGQLELHPEPFVLSEAVEDVAALVSPRVAEKNVELIVRIQPDLPEMVVGDVGRLRQILTNMAGNAAKFTEKGHVFIDVSGAVLKDDDGTSRAQLRFRVEDTGIGIPENKLASVFDKFSQVDSSATRKHEGTGLGLSISSSLVEMMNGTIGAESVLGEGSVFWFNIELPVHGEVTRTRTAPVDITGSHVLVIDDNEVNRSILCEQLRSWNLEPAACKSGEHGLRAMRAANQSGVRIDLVILDYQMPGLTGLDVLREMRAEAALSNLPVIVLSSVDNSKLSRQFHDLGVKQCLTKPTRSSLLLEVIIETISESTQSPITSFAGLVDAAVSDNEDYLASEPEREVPVAISEHHIAENMQAEFGSPEDSTGMNQPDHAPQERQPETKSIWRSSNSNHKQPDAEISSSEEAATVTVEDKAEAKPEPENAVQNLKKAPISSLQDLDILVAEDNEINQIVMSQILNDLPYSFKIVENGKLAVSAWKLHRPRLILMDVSMPEMNGKEATAAIRSIEKETGEHTPIVCVTAHALKGDHEQMLAVGMDDYLSKPISPSRLISKVREWMERESATGTGG